MRQLCCSDQLQIVPLAPAGMGLGASPRGTGEALEPTGSSQPKSKLGSQGLIYSGTTSHLWEYPGSHSGMDSQARAPGEFQCANKADHPLLVHLLSVLAHSYPTQVAPPRKICQPGGCTGCILWIRESSDTAVLNHVISSPCAKQGPADSAKRKQLSCLIWDRFTWICSLLPQNPSGSLCHK